VAPGLKLAHQAAMLGDLKVPASSGQVRLLDVMWRLAQRALFCSLRS